jgi:hypothetical protein
MSWTNTRVGNERDSESHPISYQGDLGHVVEALDGAWNESNHRLNNIYGAAREANGQPHEFKLDPNGPTYTITHTAKGFDLAKKHSY